MKLLFEFMILTEVLGRLGIDHTFMTRSSAAAEPYLVLLRDLETAKIISSATRPGFLLPYRGLCD